MNKVELEKRTLAYALTTVRFVASLPQTPVAMSLGKQLLDSGTSVGANYREANRAESRNDFVHKIGIVLKEASESEYWWTLFHESGIGDQALVKTMLKEAGELVAIFASARRTARARDGKL
jgi:four helix bundle protein